MEMFYNNTSSFSTSKTPFKIVYGKEFNVPGKMTTMQQDDQEELLTPPVEQHIQKLRAVHQTVADSLDQARQK